MAFFVFVDIAIYLNVHCDILTPYHYLKKDY